MYLHCQYLKCLKSSVFQTYVLEAHPGRIRAILNTETVKLPFGKMDSKATLLLFDRVKFQLLTNIITKVRRATNVTPQMPETFQLTKELREKVRETLIKALTRKLLQLYELISSYFTLNSNILFALNIWHFNFLN